MRLSVCAVSLLFSRPIALPLHANAVCVTGAAQNGSARVFSFWHENAAEDGLEPWGGPWQEQGGLHHAPHAGRQDGQERCEILNFTLEASEWAGYFTHA